MVVEAGRGEGVAGLQLLQVEAAPHFIHGQ
jgi:hypothetical protein